MRSASRVTLPRVAVVAFAIAFAACRPKPKPTAIEAGVPDAASGPRLYLHSRHSTGLVNVRLEPLADGVVVVESDAASRRISTLRAGGRPQVLAPTRSWADYDDSFGDVLWGNTEELFIPLAGGSLLHATPNTRTTIARRYRHIVEFRPGQWIGARSRAADVDDRDPLEYDVLAGTGDVPIIPSHIRPRWLVRLGDGRFCAHSTEVKNDVRGAHVVWTVDAEGHQHIAPLPSPDDPTFTRLFRGADGDCWVLHRGSGEAADTFTVYPVRGDELGKPTLLAGIGGLSTALFDREGGIWRFGANGTPHRIVVEDGKVRTTAYAFPEHLPTCPRPRAEDVAARGPEDAWIVAHCVDAAGKPDATVPRHLFHTKPIEGEVYTWPSLL